MPRFLPHSLALAGTAALLLLLLPPLPSQSTATVPPRGAASPAKRIEKILAGAVPETVADLKAMERHVHELLEKVLPCTVSVGGASGVLVAERLILSAGHVTRQAGRKVQITLHDGRKIEARTLGANLNSDAGLLRIVTEGEFPHLQMGSSKDLRPGQWCMMLGNAGGRKEGRTPPVRLGRVQRQAEIGARGTAGYLVTDCTMASGDSGGPLFDMQGRVIGINSRISRNLATNMHVPIDAFHQSWKNLLAGEVTGRRGRTVEDFGARHDPDSREYRVMEVKAGSPAAKAGVKVGDRLLGLNGKRVSRARWLARRLRDVKPDVAHKLEVRRDGKILELEVTMKRRQR